METEKGIALIGVPLDENSSYMRGAVAGARAGIEAVWCESANLWTETGHDLSRALQNAGPVDFAGAESPGARMERVARSARAVGESGALPIFVGGDHSITYPLVRGLREAVGEFDILHFDAHPDCYDLFDGNPASHASPFARIMEQGLCGRLVSVGIRTATGHQREQRERLGIEWLEMRHRASWPALSFARPVYVSFDLDVLDPAHAPGVAHHEPGGLTTRQALDIIQAINAPMVGADVVELNPARDRDGVTAMTAAKIIRELAGMMLDGMGLAGVKKAG
ncbi:agmatinase family protein [Pseudodesulfovibrio aespoeensis]|uniref:agmatinase family protein n=1 Tax=Pseudodesulfovibrio aespoeensis TaxID=182210 RepID=UPI0023560993|nr:agmatinase family protein [Pseudodesulfovibrio aespoeensis]MCG2734445.1 agmatinase family protein [Pseudodesulfovibrio aespoeensis]